MRQIAELLAKTLVDSGWAKSVKGCSEANVVALEQELGYALPAEYKKFLLVMGIEANGFEDDALWTFDMLPDIEKRAHEIIQNSARNSDGELIREPFKLPEKAFVYLAGDTDFIFFDASLGDDPPVHLYVETQDVPSKSINSFTEWLQFELDDIVETAADLERAREWRIKHGLPPEAIHCYEEQQGRNLPPV